MGTSIATFCTQSHVLMSPAQRGVGRSSPESLVLSDGSRELQERGRGTPEERGYGFRA